jgi:hypothetical protein
VTSTGVDQEFQRIVFGPTNVHLHALSIEMLAGEGAEGLRLAEAVDVSKLASRERQFTFTLDLARCYDLRREDAAVLVHLLDLEKLSPQDMARSTIAADMINGLLQRARPTYRHQVLGLAERMSLPDPNSQFPRTPRSGRHPHTPLASGATAAATR